MLQGLGSPAGVDSPVAASASTTVSPAVKNKNRAQSRRRETADFSALHSLLDDPEDMTTTTAAAAAAARDDAVEIPAAFPRRDSEDGRLPGLAARAGVDGRGGGVEEGEEGGGEGGDETANLSALVALAGEDMAGAAFPGGSCVALRARARRHSNQKPGSDGMLASLVAPPSVVPGVGRAVVGGGGVGGGGGGGGKVPGPVNLQPRSPARRPRRSTNLDSFGVSAAPWEEEVEEEEEDYALPTPELVRAGAVGSGRCRRYSLSRSSGLYWFVSVDVFFCSMESLDSLQSGF